MKHQDQSTTPEDSASSGEETQSSTDANFVTQEQFSEVQKALEGITKTNNYFQTTIREIKKLMQDASEPPAGLKPEKKDDKNPALQEIENLRKEIEAEKAKAEALKVQAFAQDKFGDQFAQGMLRDYWQVHGKNWKLGQNERGESALIHQERDWVDFSEEIKRLEKEAPAYLKDKSKPGTGLHEKGNISQKSTLPSNFGSMSQKEKEVFLKENPEVRKELGKNLTLRGHG